KKPGSEGDTAGATASAGEETAPRKRGRPRKVVAEAAEPVAAAQVEVDGASGASADAVEPKAGAPAAAPKRRGRPPKVKPQEDAQPQAEPATTAPSSAGNDDGDSERGARSAPSGAEDRDAQGAEVRTGGDTPVASNEPARDRGRERGRDG